ncbi:MAG: acyltransferase family protein [Acidimicrobiia bacterium]
MTDVADQRSRRVAIDVARVLALGLVVLGHLSLAVIDEADGKIRGANLLELRPGWAWIAAMAPMPVFFAAAGWANAAGTAQSVAPRLRTLAGLATIVVGCWAVAVIVAVAVNGKAGVVGDGARIATQPLWFVAAYAPMAAAGRRLATVAARHPVVVLGACLGMLAALDAGRFAFDLPDWIGWPGFYIAWGVPWLAGGWWRDRSERGHVDERARGLLIVAVAVAASVALVHLAGYSPALIDAVPGARSNTTPPTLYTAVVGLAQVGVLLVAARSLDRLGRRWRRLWDRAGSVAVGVYAWHLTALALCAAVVAGGFLPTPVRLTRLWWITRPVWFAAVLAVTGALVAVTAAAISDRHTGRDERTLPGRTRAALGAGVAAAAAAGVGLEGVRSVPRALVWTAGFALSWALLGGSMGPSISSFATGGRARRRES